MHLFYCKLFILKLSLLLVILSDTKTDYWIDTCDVRIHILRCDLLYYCHLFYVAIFCTNFIYSTLPSIVLLPSFYVAIILRCHLLYHCHLFSVAIYCTNVIYFTLPSHVLFPSILRCHLLYYCHLFYVAIYSTLPLLY